MSKVQIYYQNEAIKLNEFENALKSEILESEMKAQHLQEMKDDANFWAKVDAHEFERENETFNYELN